MIADELEVGVIDVDFSIADGPSTPLVDAAGTASPLGSILAEEVKVPVPTFTAVADGFDGRCVV